jgi:hypothetical protein
VFVLDRPFQPNLMFARKTGAYKSGAPPSLGRLLTLLTNIRLGLKGLPEKISLAYNEDYDGHKKYYSISSWLQIRLGPSLNERTCKALHLNRVRFYLQV